MANDGGQTSASEEAEMSDALDTLLEQARARIAALEAECARKDEALGSVAAILITLHDHEASLCGNQTCRALKVIEALSPSEKAPKKEPCCPHIGHWLTPGNECHGNNSKPGDRWEDKSDV